MIQFPKILNNRLSLIQIALSCFLLFLVFNSYAQINCCCGTPNELDFPGFDFELDPIPAPAGYNYYFAVSNLGPWTITQGIVDHGDKDYCGGLAFGNPNGASNFIDLFGSAPGGSTVGTIAVSYTHLRAHETVLDLVCRLLLEKKKKTVSDNNHS